MRWITVILCVLANLMTNPTPIQTPLPQHDDKLAIQKLTEDWVSAVRKKDIARLTSMVTDDAVFLPPGFPPIRGKEAVAAMYNRVLSSIQQRGADGIDRRSGSGR